MFQRLLFLASHISWFLAPSLSALSGNKNNTNSVHCHATVFFSTDELWKKNLALQRYKTILKGKILQSEVFFFLTTPTQGIASIGLE